MSISDILIERIDALYPRLVLLDSLSVKPRYFFLLARLIEGMSAQLKEGQSIEIYKIEYEPTSLLPTLYLISSPGVDDVALERLFDEITPLLQQVAKGQRICVNKEQVALEMLLEQMVARSPELNKKLACLFSSKESALHWMTTPKAPLLGRSPAECLGDDIDLVKELLDRIEASDFT